MEDNYKGNISMIEKLTNDVFLWILLLIIFLLVSKKITDKKIEKNQEKDVSQQEKKILEEINKRNIILEKVNNFIKNSKFVEPIAVWGGENIYRYIFNSGKLYEFEDIMTENNQRVGIDEEYLCFKKFCYKRVKNPIEFINKFGDALKIKKEEVKTVDLVIN